MKRILSFSICFLFLLCTGCENLKDVKNEPLNFSGFTAVISLDMNGITLISNVTYDLANGYKFTFSSPETLKGTSISGKEGDFTLNGESLTLQLKSEDLPCAMICRAVYDCVNAVSGALPIEENDSLQYAYKTDDVSCVLYTDEQKNFKKLIVGNKEFIFTDFSYSE